MSEQKTAAQPGDIDQYSMADPAVQQCPHAYYAAMRKQSPVHRDPGTGFYWVAQHDDVVKTSMDAATFSSKSPLVVKKNLRPRAQALWDAAGLQIIDTLVTSDPPEHENYRAVGFSLFNPKKVADMGPYIERRVHEIIDSLGSENEFNFVERIATVLPSSIVCDEFGFPPEDRASFKHWTDAIFGLMIPGISEDEECALVERQIELFRYLESHITRAQQQSSGRVIDALANMPRKDGTPFTNMERGWMAVATFVGANDTTIGMLTGGIARIAANPELQAKLRAEPALINAFIEEMLRLESSVQSLIRVTTRDVELNGTTIPKGSDVLLCTASANRDESRWSNPDEFRLDRPDGRRHLGFGQGIHSCVGMHLARKLLYAAYDTMLKRWSKIELITADPNAELIPLPFHRAYMRMDIRVTPA